MSETKLEVIAGTLAKQVERNRELARVAQRELHEHNGAGQVLTLLGKQMPSFASEIEKRIEADKMMGSETPGMSCRTPRTSSRDFRRCASNRLCTSATRC